MSHPIPGVRAVLSAPPRQIALAEASPAARSYIAAVEAADTQRLEPAVIMAMARLFNGIAADNGGSLAAFSQVALLAGPRTIAGCMVNMTGGVAPTSVNFVSGDLSRQAGLLGDGATKHINTNIAGSAFAQDNISAFLWVSTAGDTLTTRVLLGDSTGAGGTTIRSIVTTGALRTTAQNSTVDDTASQGTTTGLKGVSRSAAASYALRSGGANSTITRTSNGAAASTFGVFALDGVTPSARWNGRCAAYGLATAVTLSLMETRLQAYLNALAAAGI